MGHSIVPPLELVIGTGLWGICAGILIGFLFGVRAGWQLSASSKD